MKELIITYLYLNNIDVYFFIFYCVITFVIKSTFSVRFYSAISYNIAYGLLAIYYILNWSHLTWSPIWSGIGEFPFPITMIKILIVGFWFFFTNYLFAFYKEEYFKRGEEKIFCIDLAFCGALLLVSSSNMLEIFLAIEIISFPSYVFIALDRNKYATEAALKYFLFSVFGTLCFILSFIILYIATGEVMITQVALYGADPKVGFAINLWFLAFFTKIGVGPFIQWVPAVYQATSGPVFIFISVLAKVPLIFPLLFLTTSVMAVDNCYIPSVSMTVLLLIGAFFAAGSLEAEDDVRKIFAYTSIINFTTIILAAIYGVSASALLILFFYLYLISTFGTYVWHSVLNTDPFGKQEVTNLNSFNKNNKLGVVMFGLFILLNSGLPPIILFILKLLAIGAITTTKILYMDNLPFFTATVMLGFSLMAYYSYFKILIVITLTLKDNKIPSVYWKLRPEDENKFIFAAELSIYTIFCFILIIKFLFI